MAGFAEMCGGMLRRRGITAADMSAFQAEPQMDPHRPVPQTLLTPAWSPRLGRLRTILQVFAIANRARTQFGLAPGGCLVFIQPIEIGFLDIEGIENASEHRLVDSAKSPDA